MHEVDDGLSGHLREVGGADHRETRGVHVEQQAVLRHQLHARGLGVDDGAQPALAEGFLRERRFQRARTLRVFRLCLLGAARSCDGRPLMLRVDSVNARQQLEGPSRLCHGRGGMVCQRPPPRQPRPQPRACRTSPHNCPSFPHMPPATTGRPPTRARSSPARRPGCGRAAAGRTRAARR